VNAGWVLEPNQGFLFQTQVTGSVEIFRLYNTTTGKHVFTSSTTERDTLLAGTGWQLHSHLGFAFLPTSNTQPAVALPMMAAATASPSDSSSSAPSIPGIADDVSTSITVASAETSTTSFTSNSGPIAGGSMTTSDDDLDQLWETIAQNLTSDPAAELLE